MKRLLLTVLMFTFIAVVQAQVPQKLNYQGVARNESGSPITYQNITVRISIIDSAAGGQIVYRETRRVMTNYVGLFNILIGSSGATNVLGSIQDVNWPTGRKHIKLEIDPNGLNNFSLAGITELQSVPYALSALPAGQAGGDLTGNYPYPRIADNAITNSKIADGIISFSKLDPDLATTLTNKLNISDTARMLSPYATKALVSILSASKLNTSDTAAMLSPYYHSSTAEAQFAITNTNLNNEISRATDTESVLKAGLTSEANRAITAEALKEDVANKSVDGRFASNSDTKYPSEKATKTYVDATASQNSAGLDSEVTRAKTAESGLASQLSAESLDRTIADSTETANRTNADLLLNFAKEDIANKSTNIIADGSSDTKYPTVKSVKDYVDAFSSGSNTDISAEIANRIAGDSKLTSSLSLESSDRTTADSTETANRKNADSLLNSAKEDLANKSTNIIADGSSDTKYPTVKSVKDYVDAFSSGSNTDISAEVANRIAGDSTLTSNLLAESSDRTTADSTETANRTDADNLLASNLSTEVINRNIADSALTANLNTEVTNRTNGDSLLNSAKEDISNKSTNIIADGSSDTKYPTVKSVKDYVDAFSLGSNTDISAEIANRIAGDSTLTSSLSLESSDRTTADSTEIANRKNADSLLNSAKEDLANKSTNIIADGSSDTKYPTVKSVKDYVDAFSLGSNTDISAEVANRIAGDSTLTSNLSAESHGRTTADSTETANRTEADATITNNLNNEVTRATAVEATKENVANKSTDIATDATSDIKYPSVKSVKNYLDSTAAVISVQIATAITNATISQGALTTKMATETTNRIYADSTITSNLNNEIARATTAETLLGTTKENVVNKSTNISTDAASDTKYPSVKSVKHYVDSTSTGSSAALTTEVNRATAAEGVLTTNLNTEITNRVTSDSTTNSNLDNEVTRATTAEALLTTTKEDVANKSTSTALGTSDVLFPTQNAVKTYVDTKDTATQTAMNMKVNIADTAAMLLPYAKQAASLVREVDDEFTATAAQITFPLTQVPSVNSKVKMYINGIRISKNAHKMSNNTLTYMPAYNGNYALAVGDRVQFDYYY